LSIAKEPSPLICRSVKSTSRASGVSLHDSLDVSEGCLSRRNLSVTVFEPRELGEAVIELRQPQEEIDREVLVLGLLCP
jgi:hypothetical protein